MDKNKVKVGDLVRVKKGKLPVSQASEKKYASRSDVIRLGHVDGNFGTVIFINNEDCLNGNYWALISGRRGSIAYFFDDLDVLDFRVGDYVKVIKKVEVDREGRDMGWSSPIMDNMLIGNVYLVEQTRGHYRVAIKKGWWVSPEALEKVDRECPYIYYHNMGKGKTATYTEERKILHPDAPNPKAIKSPSPNIAKVHYRDLENGMVEIVKLENFMSCEDICKKHGKAILDKYFTDGPHMARANDSEEVTVRTKTFAIHEMRNGQSLGAAYFKTAIEDMKEAGANLVKCIREVRAAEKRERGAKRMAEIKVIEI